MTHQSPDISSWFEETAGLCPTCLRDVPARLFICDGKVWIEHTCPTHGSGRALIASDAGEYMRLREFVPDRSGANCCCGSTGACGDGPPVCILLVEITQACNLRCPACFADTHGHDFMSVGQIKARLDAFFKKQWSLDVLMISGGEPTIHPRFEEILDLALSYPVERVLVNTNGIRFAQHDPLVATLAARRSRVELYLSLSSFRADGHERFYGRDVRAEKLGAIERAQKSGIFVTLVPTIEQGVNDDEIGDFYRFALAYDNINGINYQPVMSAGRYEHAYEPENRMTLTGILDALEAQTEGVLRRSDFVSLPCSHPDCCALTYGFLDAKRETIAPLPRYLNIARYMELFSDRISFSGLIGGALLRLLSDAVRLRAGQTVRDLMRLFAAPQLRDLLLLAYRSEHFGKRVMRIAVKPFMDAHTFDRSRVQQCCTKIVLDDGSTESLCAYNTLRRQLARVAERSGSVQLTVVGDV